MIGFIALAWPIMYCYHVIDAVSIGLRAFGSADLSVIHGLLRFNGECSGSSGSSLMI